MQLSLAFVFVFVFVSSCVVLSLSSLCPVFCLLVVFVIVLSLSCVGLCLILSLSRPVLGLSCLRRVLSSYLQSPLLHYMLLSFLCLCLAHPVGDFPNFGEEEEGSDDDDDDEGFKLLTQIRQKRMQQVVFF